MTTSSSSREPVGDFYAYVVQGQTVGSEMMSSTKLLTQQGRPTVIHFYDGGWGGCRPCAAQMEKWALNYVGVVQFLCVCVESGAVAQLFDRMFQFQHAVNCYIPSRGYLPRGYGQLGCSGFIVADAKGNFVSLKTKAYLQYGEAAFSHVEQLLARELQQQKGVGSGVSTATDAPTTLQIEGRERDTTAQKKKDASVPSIGISSVDQEHEQCAKALEALMEQPTQETLQAALQELLVHFQHEEDLLSKHGFGGDANDPFSALHSHIQDHERILGLGYAQLFKKEEAATCQIGAAWHSAPAKTTPDSRAVTALVEAFQRHATLFDSLYADHIPSH